MEAHQLLFCFKCILENREKLSVILPLWMNACVEMVFVLTTESFQGLNTSCDIPISGREGC